MDIIDKINLYSYSHQEVQDMKTLMEIAMFMEEDVAVINEAGFDIKGKLNSAMKMLGIHGHKTGDGVIQVALKSGKILAELLWYTIKAATGDEKAKAKVKELANTEITKEQVLDFLLKLDMLSLHAISGPLHMLDALTGWHIWAHVKKTVEPVAKRAKVAIENLKQLAGQLEAKAKKQVVNYIQGLARLFGFDKDEHKAIASL